MTQKLTKILMDLLFVLFVLSILQEVQTYTAVRMAAVPDALIASLQKQLDDKKPLTLANELPNANKRQKTLGDYIDGEILILDRAKCDKYNGIYAILVNAPDDANQGHVIVDIVGPIPDDRISATQKQILTNIAEKADTNTVEGLENNGWAEYVNDLLNPVQSADVEDFVNAGLSALEKAELKGMLTLSFNKVHCVVYEGNGGPSTGIRYVGVGMEIPDNNCIRILCRTEFIYMSDEPVIHRLAEIGQISWENLTSVTKAFCLGYYARIIEELKLKWNIDVKNPELLEPLRLGTPIPFRTLHYEQVLKTISHRFYVWALRNSQYFVVVLETQPFSVHGLISTPLLRYVGKPSPDSKVAYDNANEFQNESVPWVYPTDVDLTALWNDIGIQVMNQLEDKIAKKRKLQAQEDPTGIQNDPSFSQWKSKKYELSLNMERYATFQVESPNTLSYSVHIFVYRVVTKSKETHSPVIVPLKRDNTTLDAIVPAQDELSKILNLKFKCYRLIADTGALPNQI